MLDVSDDQSLMQIAWEKVDKKAVLPADLHNFFDQYGSIASRPGCRRAYNRFYIRGQAILQRNETYLGVYTADASRQGICFFSPVQILPKERCRIRLPKTKTFRSKSCAADELPTIATNVGRCSCWEQHRKIQTRCGGETLA